MSLNVMPVFANIFQTHHRSLGFVARIYDQEVLLDNYCMFGQQELKMLKTS